MTKPVVVASRNDDTGQRCIDILFCDPGFAWVECRRDPEDGHGWRRIGVPVEGHDSAQAAEAAARAAVGWFV